MSFTSSTAVRYPIGIGQAIPATLQLKRLEQFVGRRYPEVAYVIPAELLTQ